MIRITSLCITGLLLLIPLDSAVAEEWTIPPAAVLVADDLPSLSTEEVDTSIGNCTLLELPLAIWYLDCDEHREDFNDGKDKMDQGAALIMAAILFASPPGFLAGTYLYEQGAQEMSDAYNAGQQEGCW